MKTAMKHNYDAAQKAAANEAPPIDTLVRQQDNNFFVERDNTGELIDHWVDTRVDMLSSRKLWSLLGSLETPNSKVDQAFTDAITDELISRRDFVDSKPMPVSH